MHSPALQMYYSIVHYICSATDLHCVHSKTLNTTALVALFKSIIAKKYGYWHHMSHIHTKFGVITSDLFKASAVAIFIFLAVTKAKAHNKIFMSDGTPCHRIKRSYKNLGGIFVYLPLHRSECCKIDS